MKPIKVTLPHCYYPEGSYTSEALKEVENQVKEMNYFPKSLEVLNQAIDLIAGVTKVDLKKSIEQYSGGKILRVRVKGTPAL